MMVLRLITSFLFNSDLYPGWKALYPILGAAVLIMMLLLKNTYLPIKLCNLYEKSVIPYIFGIFH